MWGTLANDVHDKYTSAPGKGSLGILPDLDVVREHSLDHTLDTSLVGSGNNGAISSAQSGSTARRRGFQ